MKKIHTRYLFALLVIGVCFGFRSVQVDAACNADQYIPISYPDVLHVMSKSGVNAQYFPYVGKVYNPRPPEAPKSAGLIYIPKEACGRKVDVLITLHGWRSLSKPDVNIFLKDPGQKNFDKIIREHIDAHKIDPLVVIAPMYDRGPNESVWQPEHYNVNTLLSEAKKLVAPHNVQFTRVSLMGHSNGNCGGGQARSAKDLSGYPLYMYLSADGTCGGTDSEYPMNEDFITKHKIIETVLGKNGILFHMHTSWSDSQAAVAIKKLGGGNDPEAAYKDLYVSMWKNNSGNAFTYKMTPGGDHNHTYIPNYLLKEVLPRFFSPTPYVASESAAPTGQTDPTQANAYVSFEKLDSNEVQKLLRTPMPRITIPGLNFTEPEIIEATDQDGNKQLTVSMPIIGEYMTAVYQYGLIFASIVSVVILIRAGFMWMMSGAGDKAHAIEKIAGAIIGLVLGFGSYIILYTLNPDLVAFKSLTIPFVSRVDYRPDYEEGETGSATGEAGMSTYANGKQLSASDKCLEKEFFPGRIGMLPETEKVNMFGIKTINVNKHAAAAFAKASNDILERAKTDPEVAGYLQYMKDFKAKKVPDLLGNKDGLGDISTDIGIIGVIRKGSDKGKPRTDCLRCDMHATGLSLDIMTRSNWDVRWGGTTKGAPAQRTCGVYKSVLEKMKTGFYGEELKKDPYKMFDRLERKISSCLNRFNNGTEPYTSLPDGFIAAFEQNGFYWGGWGWGRLRSDSMHFEYVGKCGGTKEESVSEVEELEVMCCEVTNTGDRVNVQTQAQCTESKGTVVSSGAC